MKKTKTKIKLRQSLTIQIEEYYRDNPHAIRRDGPIPHQRPWRVPLMGSEQVGFESNQNMSINSVMPIDFSTL